MDTPRDVGIIAMEVYVPVQCVEQRDFEAHANVSAGKYTIGLGQDRMAFASDREDINSICLTLVQQLMEKSGTNPCDIGRLEVGTETIIDKSKSVKTTLMQLFKDSGNTDIEGIDTTNACYGGTSALFNSVNWVECRAWDGRYAIVVAADIAVYDDGPARPTGGCGGIAMLIGPNAPVVMDRVRATHMDDQYDFYKPDMSSEYPMVDGKLSIVCYLQALDTCYARLKAKKLKEGQTVDRASFDYVAWHTPFNKLIQKSYGRLMYNDFLAAPDAPEFSENAALAPFSSVPASASYGDAALTKVFTTASKEEYTSRVLPTTRLSKECGNMYTASLYSGLVSLIDSVPSDNLVGKTVLMFSYGSGCAASMFSFTIKASTADIAKALDVDALLSTRKTMTPQDFQDNMLRRQGLHNKAGWTPEDPDDFLRPGAFYLEAVDDKRRRTYGRKMKS